MGQYYRPVILNDDKETINGWASSYKYESGAKLMEHSWMENLLVATIEIALLNNPKPLVWAGDYANGELDTGGKEIIDTIKGNEYPVTLYSMCDDVTELPVVEVKASMRRRYIVNHDTKEFVDKSKMPFDNDGWQIHPLPLLTADGNGRGGGDYRKGHADFDKVGIWKRNRISIETNKNAFKGYKEISVQFNEHTPHTQVFVAK